MVGGYSSLSFNKEDRQGCMWGILHFHQWHHVKKMLPYKRITGRNTGAMRYVRLKKMVHDTGESVKAFEAEMDDPRIVEKIDNSPISKKSGKGHKKKQKTEDMFKEQDQKGKLQSSSLRFLRTGSIHHLQPSHHNLPDEVREDSKSVELNHDDVNSPSSSTWDPFLLKSPGEPFASSSLCEVCEIVNSVKSLRHNHLNELGRQFLDVALLQDYLDKATEALLKLNSVEAKQLLKDVELCRSKDILDALEILNVNKELLLKILQDPNYDLSCHLQTLQDSHVKRQLTKSGTFPNNDPSSRKIKLNPMEKNVGFFANYVGIMKPGQGNNDVGQTSTGPTPVPLTEVKKGGENRAVINRFKNLRQKIKHAIKESRKEGRRISMDAILHRVPYGRRVSKDPKREIVDKWREAVSDGDGKFSPSSYDSDISASSFGKGGLGRMRRTHSLNESLDRYSQLFESNFSKEVKPNVSDRLKVTTEDVCSLSATAPKVLARILSLPDLGSYYSIRNDGSGDASCSRALTKVHVDNNVNIRSNNSDEQKLVGVPPSIEKHTQLDAPIESGRQESPADQDQMGSVIGSRGDGIPTPAEMVDDVHDLNKREDTAISQCEQQSGSTNNSNSKTPEPSPISVLESCFQEDITSPAKFYIEEETDSDLKHQGKMDSLANLQDQSVAGFPSQAVTKVDLEKIKISSKHSESDYLNLQVNKKDEADFNYVRDVLKLSGFSGNEYLGTWHSPDLPVDPSLFEEVEACSPLKSNCSADESVSSYDHQLLFDIVNEVLLDIYDRSFFYCPRPLSCNCHIRPIPSGHHVLEEVWASISWYISSQPELEASLDYAVARDLSKGDGWMNLQFDSECVALELEEMILDDLLDEIIYS